MKKRPRILLVTIHACRMPGSGGNVRSHFFARTAAEVGELTIFSLCGATGQHFDSTIKSMCSQVIGGNSTPMSTSPISHHSRNHGLSVILAPWQKQRSVLAANCVQHCHGSSRNQGLKKRTFRRLLDMEQRLFFKFGLLPPMPCLTWYQEYRNLLTTENKRLRRESFDILWVEDVYSWPFALDIARKLETKPKIRICNSYNIESNVAARTAALVNDSSTKEAIQRDGQQLASMEREAYSRSQLTIVCSEEDRISGLRLCPSANFAVIGNGVDTAYFSLTEQPEKSYGKPLILFTGTFSYGPNHQAANYFSSEVLPLIRRQIPEVTFMIAGSQAASTYDHLKKLGIEVACVSDPADIRPCFVNASLFIVPLQTGGGTRLKILEAMAMGVPVVSTTIGAEGLGAQDHKHLMIADNAETFATRCIEVLKNSECQQQLSQNALTWVRENYDWNLLCNQAKNSVESLLGA